MKNQRPPLKSSAVHHQYIACQHAIVARDARDTRLRVRFQKLAKDEASFARSHLFLFLENGGSQ